MRLESRHQPLQAVEVGMWEWKKAKSPAIIETTGLGPCIGVGVYIPEAKVGLMGHFVEPSSRNEAPMLQSMLSAALRVSQFSENWRAYLGGGEFDPACGYEFEHIQENRSFCVDALRGIGFQDNQITIKWNDLDECMSIVLDTSTGLCTFEGLQLRDNYEFNLKF